MSEAAEGSGTNQVMVSGDAEGATLVLTEPLSFWGGVSEVSGDVIDVHHPQHGANVAGRILVMPSGRGSSSSSSVLAELIRAGLGPDAILLGERDPIIAIGAAVAETLYERTVPVLVLTLDDYRRAAGARHIRVLRSGELEVSDR
jgi:predicted aconitase with swiveling domain